MSEARYVSGKITFLGILAFCIYKELLSDEIQKHPIKFEMVEGKETKVFFINSIHEYRQSSNEKMIQEFKNEEIYVPSFLPAEIWNEAICRFKPKTKLFENVYQHLIPIINTTIENMTDQRKSEITVHYLKLNGIFEKPVRQLHGDSYYFSENEAYCLDKGSTMFPYSTIPHITTFEVHGQQFFNRRLWIKAVKRFELGMSMVECAGIFLQEEIIQNTAPVSYSFLERLISHIDPVEFERIPGNENLRSFDRIRVRVCLPKYYFETWDELVAAVKENKKEIDRQVMEKIQQDRTFNRMGVPVSFLKLSDLFLARDYTLEYVFELKRLEKGNDNT